MVTALAGTLHGRQYLAQQGIIDKISNLIVGADSDPLSGLYLPGDALGSCVISSCSSVFVGLMMRFVAYRTGEILWQSGGHGQSAADL